MSPVEFFRELGYPQRSTSILLTMFALFVIIGLIAAIAVFKIWIAAGLALVFGIFLGPGIMRYLMHIAESRATGVEAQPLVVEMLGLTGNFWALAPLPILLLFGLCSNWMHREFGEAWAIALGIGFASIFPAMIAVLVITNSVVQSLNPIAATRVISSVGASFWYAPLTAIAVVVLPALLARVSVLSAIMLSVYLVFAFFAVTGSVLREERLIEAVDIPDAIEPDVKQQLANLEKQRTGILNHAYGFASRGNREGGLQHIYAWLKQDPDPSAAWQWFFEQMLRWEQNDHALFFAQRYLSRLLASDEPVAACKLILRCRLVDKSFKPSAEDRQCAIEAAERCGNQELMDLLKRL